MATWDAFFREKIKKIFEEKKEILDIGGGLRIDRSRNNRFDETRKWIIPYLSSVNYKIMDPVNTYNPDIVGDIHKMPFPDQSIDAIICIAVLEHIENPILAVSEIYRTLKNGGYAFVYVPFLYYYHAEEGYYGDYWRYTKDSIQFLFKDFQTLEVSPVRGAIETLVRLSPIGRYKVFLYIAGIFDKLTGKVKSNQVSGYNVFVVK
jgi:ubiquinone/menaquinone biosynthesis C-methylase UbiE